MQMANFGATLAYKYWPGFFSSIIPSFVRISSGIFFVTENLEYPIELVFGNTLNEPLLWSELLKLFSWDVFEIFN